LRLLLQNILFDGLIIVVLADPRALLLELFDLFVYPRPLDHLLLLVKLCLHLADENQLVESVLRAGNALVKHTFHVLGDFRRFFVLLIWLRRFLGQLYRRYLQLLEGFQVDLSEVKYLVIENFLFMVCLKTIFGIPVLIFIESDKRRL
jgi:hypothetical protein